MKPAVSILLTSYNKPEWIRQSLDSVLAQTFTNWELLILDDNSRSDVWEIINSYDDPRVLKFNSHISEVQRYDTARYATMINFGFPYSSGKYVTYLVDDDIYYPDRLKILVDYMDANPEHEVVYHSLGNIGADNRIADIRPIKGILDGFTEETQAFNYVDHNMVMHTRKAFIEANGWYDVAGVWGGADAYFWRRLNEAGYKFYPVGTADTVLGSKRYHMTNVQRLIVEGELYPADREAKGLPPL